MEKDGKVAVLLQSHHDGQMTAAELADDLPGPDLSIGTFLALPTAFRDDYANILMVGAAMRPLADRLVRYGF